MLVALDDEVSPVLVNQGGLQNLQPGCS
jgi:hypothetical protein